jgi:hypothetical protein
MIPGMGGGGVTAPITGGGSSASSSFNPVFGAVNVGSMDWKKTLIYAGAAVFIVFAFVALKKRRA